MAEVKITVEKPEDLADSDPVEVVAGKPLLLRVKKDGKEVTGAKWTRDGEDVEPGGKVDIAEVGEGDAGTYKAEVGSDSDTVTITVKASEPPDTVSDPAEIGAYSQFEPDQLQGIAQRLWTVPKITAVALGVSLVVFGVIGPWNSGPGWGPTLEAGERFSAAFSTTLFLAGIIVVCIGAWLQAASLRVAKLRPKEGPELRAEGTRMLAGGLPVAAVGDLISKMADAAKSLKVPVAVVLVGAAMVIMSAVTVINTEGDEPCFTIDTGAGEPVEVRGAEQPDEVPEGVTFGTCS